MNDGIKPSKKVDAQTTHALVLLAKEIASQIDEIASLRKAGYDARISQQMLREMCSVLQELPEHLKEKYFEILPKLLKASRPREVQYSEEYAKYSTQSKKRFLDFIRESFRSKAA